ncbi:MAG TPA: GGDEF domain-containing protein [Solirubrobacterales bacterium]|jgi:diguanylate cyclase (GGDEF)-like protein
MPVAGPTSTAHTLVQSELERERARMGRVSGILWTVSGLVALVCIFLPGSDHAGLGWVLGLVVVVLLYGTGSITGVIPWQRASLDQLAWGTVATIPVVGLGIYLSGGSISFVEPLLVCSLLYIAFYFPARWAWPLAIELVLVAGAPLLYDPDAIEQAFLPRYLALAAAFLAATWVMLGLKSRLVGAEERQRQFASRDPLTGVGNRRDFDQALRAELERRGGRRGADASPLALLIVDLDDFKSVNDGYGHPVGDAVLREAATRIRAALRSDDRLARIGGDEFAVIAPGANEIGARTLAEALRIALVADAGESGMPAPAASVGWAVYQLDGEDYETLMQAADRRMMRLKRNSRRLVADLRMLG